jgi:hypothetical protein
MYGELNNSYGWDGPGKLNAWRYKKHQGIPFVKYNYVNPTK